MGESVAKFIYANDEDKRKMEERTGILEKMVQSHLKKKKHHIISGERGNQEIHRGTVVEEFKQVNLVMEGKASPELENAVDNCFTTWLASGSVFTLAFDRFLATCQRVNTGTYAGGWFDFP